MSMQEKLRNFLANQNFEQLASYAAPPVLQTMTHEERELLGILFIKQGENQIKNGDQRSLDSLETAVKVAPDSHNVFFRQALVYASQGQNIRSLLAAKQALEHAIDLNPNFFNAWHSLGNVLVRIGAFHENIDYFYEADKKFAQASQLCNHTTSRQQSTLLWHWGMCWYHIGCCSGEVADYLKGLEKFRKAENLGHCEGEFYNDFGNFLVDIARLMERTELLVEAAKCYRQFISEHPSELKGWLNLACTNRHLYTLCHSKSYADNAETAFHSAAEIDPTHVPTLVHWAELDLSIAKHHRSIKHLQKSLEKFEKANELEADNHQTLLGWADAQILQGIHNEDLSLLHAAQNKISWVLKALPENPIAWHLLGICLMEFGRYFSSADYYQKALTQLRRGLAFNPAHFLLLHASASAYAAIGELTEDETALEQAIQIYKKIFDSRINQSPQLLSDWGLALLHLGELTQEQIYIEQTVEKLEQAISLQLEIGHGDDQVLDWLYHYGCALDFLGDFYEEASYYEKAVQALSHVLRFDTENTYARYHLAVALFHLGELTEDVEPLYKAIDVFHSLIEADPEDEVAWHDYGLTLLHLASLLYDETNLKQSQQLLTQADSKLQQAAALGHLQAFYHLACVQALLNNTSLAVYYLERAEQCETLPSADEVMHDEWLKSLKHHTAFRFFISRLLSKESSESE